MTNKKPGKKLEIPQREGGRKKGVFDHHRVRFPYPPQNEYDRDRQEAIKEFFPVSSDSLATHPLQSDGYPQETMATHLPTGSTPVATHLPTTETPSNLVATHSIKPLATHRIEGNRRSHEKQFSIRVDAEILKRVFVFCSELGISHKEFYESVATHALNAMGSPLAEAFKPFMGSKLPHDDMMTFTTHDDVIMRYQDYTNQKWTRRDDREGQKYNTTDIRLVEIAFILTIERKLRGNTAKQPINSFSYFTQEINLIVEQKRAGELPIAIDEYYKYALHTWATRIRPIRDAKWAGK